mmetsp:Transcript_12160/g.21702  ORF Transcript_12160/g.21702 Transcript_12160/m.21702 type:complete len:208 (-) Transcript_12160:146-769(-)
MCPASTAARQTSWWRRQGGCWTTWRTRPASARPVPASSASSWTSATSCSTWASGPPSSRSCSTCPPSPGGRRCSSVRPCRRTCRRWPVSASTPPTSWWTAWARRQARTSRCRRPSWSAPWRTSWGSWHRSLRRAGRCRATSSLCSSPPPASPSSTPRSSISWESLCWKFTQERARVTEPKLATSSGLGTALSCSPVMFQQEEWIILM